MKRINQNKEDKNQDNQIKNNQKNKNESKNNINNEKNINHNNHNNNNTNNDNKTKNETNKNNTNTKKKTRRKIALPRIKDIQTTPDTSLLHPILEDNLVMCIHGGKVNLKAKNAKRIQSNHIPIMLNNEIQGASISGCLNPPILGGPCSKVALVFPYTFTQHQVNNKRAVLQMGLIGVSDKAYPILAIPKKNTIKFSPMKLKANPLDKIEYERIQWEGIKKEEESKKDKKEAKRSEGIISLHFNGKLLTIIINKDDKEVQRISFQAVSGRAEKINNKYYFTYEKERQMLKDKGPIPEGEYYIDMEKITEAVFYRNISWGKKNVPIELNNQETYGRDGFYIHGGWSAGSAGCIDLWDKNEMFFEKLIKLSKKFNAHRIPLVVEYKDSIMECSENLLGLIKQCEAKR